MQSQTEVKESFKLLVMASLLTVVLWFIPFAGVITYPISLFGTFIHEAGHAIAALITLGSVERITMEWDGRRFDVGKSRLEASIPERRLLVHDALRRWLVAFFETGAQRAHCRDRHRRFIVADHDLFRRKHCRVACRVGFWNRLSRAGIERQAEGHTLCDELSGSPMRIERAL